MVLFLLVARCSLGTESAKAGPSPATRELSTIPPLIRENRLGAAGTNNFSGGRHSRKGFSPEGDEKYLVLLISFFLSCAKEASRWAVPNYR
jgi:hypothetical protein